jgi:hypothetical protein
MSGEGRAATFGFSTFQISVKFLAAKLATSGAFFPNGTQYI